MSQGSSARSEQAAHNRQAVGSNPTPATNPPGSLSDELAGLAADIAETTQEYLKADGRLNERSTWNTVGWLLVYVLAAGLLAFFWDNAVDILRHWPAY